LQRFVQRHISIMDNSNMSSFRSGTSHCSSLTYPRNELNATQLSQSQSSKFASIWTQYSQLTENGSKRRRSEKRYRASSIAW